MEFIADLKLIIQYLILGLVQGVTEPIPDFFQRSSHHF